MQSLAPSFLPRLVANLQKANPNLTALQNRSCYCVRARHISIKDHNYKLPQSGSKCSTEIKVELSTSILGPVIAATHVERHVEDIVKRAIALRSVNELLAHGCVVVL